MEEKGEGVGAKLDTHTREEEGASTAQRHTAGGGGGGPDRQATAAGSDPATKLAGGYPNRGGEGL
jgi:hypothetical protein